MATTESQNNDLPSGADTLDLGSLLTGGLTTADVDYYKVEADNFAADSLLTVDFAPVEQGVGKSWTVSLVDSTGTLLAGQAAQTVTGPSTLSTRVAVTDGVASNVFVKVTSDTTGSLGYTLLAASAPAEESEPNNSAASDAATDVTNANPLTPYVSFEAAAGEAGAPASDDLDWFLFTVVGNGTVNLSFNAPTSTATSTIYQATVTDGNGQAVVQDAQQVKKQFGGGDTTSGTLSFTGSAGTTYFLKVEVLETAADEFDANTAADGRESYTVRLLASSTAIINTRPEVQMGDFRSLETDEVVDSGEQVSVKFGTSVDVSDFVTVSDADGVGTVEAVFFKLVDPTRSDTGGDADDVADDGFITIGGTNYTSDAAATGVYNQVTLAEWLTATYTAGDDANTQQLHVYARDDSGAQDSVPVGETLAFQSSVDQSGRIFMSLASVDADVTATVTGGSTFDLTEVASGALGAAALVTFATEGTLGGSATVSVELFAETAGGAEVQDLEFYLNDELLENNLFTLSDANSSKQIKIIAVEDGASDPEDLTLGFRTVSSGNSAFDGIEKRYGTVSVLEDRATLTLSAPVFSDGASTKLTEDDESLTATYTLSATGLTADLSVEITTTGGLSVATDTGSGVTAGVFTLTNSGDGTDSQTIVVSAVDDDQVEAPTHAGTISFTVTEDGAPGKYANVVADQDGVLDDTVQVSVTDNDAVSGSSGGTVSFWKTYNSVSPVMASETYTVTQLDDNDDPVPDSGVEVTTGTDGGLDLSAFVGQSVQITGTSAAAESAINISDAVGVLKHIVGLETYTGAQFVAADVNGDGAVNISDAVGILKIIVGLETGGDVVCVDDTNSSVLSVLPDSSLSLTAVALGDVDGSLATAEIL